MPYHWPSFTAVTEACKHNLMIFTLANCISPAGMHLAWVTQLIYCASHMLQVWLLTQASHTNPSHQTKSWWIISASCRWTVMLWHVYSFAPQLGFGTIPKAARLSFSMPPLSGMKVCAKNSTFYSRDLNDLITTCMFFHYENALMEACWVKVRGVLATNLGTHCARAMWTWWLPFPLHLLSTYPGTLYGYLNWSFKSLE